MAFRGSFSRSLFASARSSFRSSAPLPRQRPGHTTGPRLPASGTRRPLAALGCSQSLLPLHSVVAATRLTSHLSVNARACFELSQGTFCRTCQDR
ncbi:unnamed protein product [Spirodela intermedia]|uniref:Uncharacterized protein n=1 Tax=Spirodela intermedia TaxID=51605 RepID=A0A7I8KPH1_SPIIN|nr:unnamed protein product [Spirodela intermedia]